MRTISTYAHGILDYIIGILLILAPNIFGFAALNGPSVAVARVFGVITIVHALFTNYDLGIFRVLPLRMHLFDDYILSAILAASPWIWGFSRLTLNAWLPQLIIGCVWFAITSMTRTSPRMIRIEREA